MNMDDEALARVGGVLDAVEVAIILLFGLLFTCWWCGRAELRLKPNKLANPAKPMEPHLSQQAAADKNDMRDVP
jgi:hypothetical protein